MKAKPLKHMMQMPSMIALRANQLQTPHSEPAVRTLISWINISVLLGLGAISSIFGIKRACMDLWMAIVLVAVLFELLLIPKAL